MGKVKSEGVVEATKEAAAEVAEDVKEAVQEAVETVKETVTGAVEDAKSGKLEEQAKQAVADAGAAFNGVTAAAAAAMAPSVVIIFEQGGKSTEVKLEKRPLGFEYG